MKMFYFNPNTYGHTYTIMAETEENACTYLYDYLNKKDIETLQYEKKFYEDTFNDPTFNGISYSYNPETNTLKEPSFWYREKNYIFNDNKLLKKSTRTTIESFTEGQVLVLEIG